MSQADGKESACIQKIGVQSLGWEDPLEEGMATHSSILSWRFPWTEKPGELQSMGSQSDRTERLTLSFHFTFMAAKRAHSTVHGAGRMCLANGSHGWTLSTITVKSLVPTHSLNLLLQRPF